MTRVQRIPSTKTTGSEPIVLDPAMRRIRSLVERIAPAEIAVLLLGETGVGKEVIARAIHERSARKGRPFLGINCAALSESLLASELFGRERGAFTGADRAKPGLLEAASGGTVFLDEVGELPLSVQAKLLRVLEVRKVLPVGALEPRPIDVRFVSATNRDLADELARGRFRRDLYFRLDGISLVIPPLRERRAEIEPLARAFLARACQGLGRPVPEIQAVALEALRRHSWPGNVRELRNAIDRAALLCSEGSVSCEDLGLAAMPRSGAAGGGAASLRGEIAALERTWIVDALARCGGNQTRAAKLLRMPRRTLVKRLAAYDVPRPRKRS